MSDTFTARELHTNAGLNHAELRTWCERYKDVSITINGVEVPFSPFTEGCRSILDEIALLEEQRGGNTTPIFWELLAERDKLKEGVKQLKATREASEPLIRRLNEADQAKQVDKHIGLTPDDWTTWVRVGDLRRLKEAHKDKDYDN